MGLPVGGVTASSNPRKGLKRTDAAPAADALRNVLLFQLLLDGALLIDLPRVFRSPFESEIPY